MKSRKTTASDDELPAEKWLVAFQNPASKKYTKKGPVIMRQFYSTGYYEAYDTVLTHAEKTNLEVLWFREKRLCEPLINVNFQELESICTYCNKRFNHAEPVPCVDERCNAEFCSKQCMADHKAMRHKN